MARAVRETTRLVGPGRGDLAGRGTGRGVVSAREEPCRYLKGGATRSRRPDRGDCPAVAGWPRASPPTAGRLAPGGWWRARRSARSRSDGSTPCGFNRGLIRVDTVGGGAGGSSLPHKSRACCRRAAPPCPDRLTSASRSSVQFRRYIRRNCTLVARDRPSDTGANESAGVPWGERLQDRVCSSVGYIRRNCTPVARTGLAGSYRSKPDLSQLPGSNSPASMFHVKHELDT